MKTTFRHILLLAALSLSLVSCHQSDGEYLWGKVSSFDSNFMCHYTPDTICQTLDFAIGEDAFTQPVTLALYHINEHTGAYEPIPSTIELYADGVLCDSRKQQFTVKPGQQSVTLGVVFGPEAESGTYTWYLKVIQAGDLDLINGNPASGDMPMLFSWNARKTKRMNPASATLLTIGIVILTCLLLWLCLLRFIFYPRFHGLHHLTIEVGDVHRAINLRGVHRVVLTAKRQQQNVLAGFFTGKVVYWQHDFFAPGDVEISPRDKRSARLRATCYDASDNRLRHDEELRVSRLDDRKKAATLKV